MLIPESHHRQLSARARRTFWRLFTLLLLMVMHTSARASAPLRFENPLEHLDQKAHQIGGIRSIVQDKQGFIWLGGENGLGRFDGKTIRLYLSRASRAGTLPGNYIWALAVDHSQVMWVASDGGLSRYDAATDTFETFEAAEGTPLAERGATALAVADDNTLYVGSSRGFYRINAARDQVEWFVPTPPVDRPPIQEQVRDLATGPDGALWIATAGVGVARFDPVEESFRYFLHDPNEANSLAYDDVKTLWVADTGEIWMGTHGGGVSVYTPATDDFRHYVYHPTASSGLRSSVIWDIRQDSQGTIWLTLEQGGLARYNPAVDTFDHFMHRPYDATTVVSNQLRPIFEDRNGDLWIGAFPSGVSFHNRSRELFRTYKAQVTNSDGLRHEAITSLFQDSRGTVWVGTEGGLHAMEPKTGVFRHYGADPSDPHALAANPVLAIEEDSRGALWVGTWAGGLHRFNRETEKFHRYQDEKNPGSIGSNFIWDIHEDSSGRLWIASETNGLYLYNRDSDDFTSYRHNRADATSISGIFIWTLEEDRAGHLWLGTFNGLDRFNTRTRKARRFPTGAKDGKAVSSGRIISLREDSRGLIWVGTQDRGLNIYDPRAETFEYVDVQQGLPSPTVSSILEDDQGHMWLATASGLARLTYPSMSVTVYGQEHGLAGSNFNRDASLKDSEGNLYFGSTEGLTIFHPDDLASQDLEFPVRLTEFRIFNQRVTVGPDQPLERSVTLAREIRLKHTDRMFSFEFAGLNYRNPASVRYAYRLKGFDKGWNYVDTQASATYTNLEPGTYSFHVKANSGNDQWQMAPPVKLIIEPPPWRTWWAYLGYAAIAGVALYFRREYRRLRRSAESYRAQSITDQLTGLYNRAGVWQVVEGLFSSAETRRDAAVLLLDIDHFKHINDRRGHDVGDGVLQDVAQRLMQNVRRGDYLGRWGGEEFILLCPSTDAPAATNVAEKLRLAVCSRPFSVDGAPVEITLSIGVANASRHETFQKVLKRADVALYQAKTTGRNRVCVASEEAERR